MDRKDAIEIVKRLYNNSLFLKKDKEAMLTLVPELAESDDERIREEMIRYFTEMKKGGSASLPYDDCIAYLERQKEQKPAEWSEEDEDMLNSCISSIEEAKENRYAYKETDGDTSYDHEIAWLESLRNRVGKEFLQPHWKPSEEQMKALKEAYESYDFCDGERGALESLYNYIKRL